MTTKNFNVKNGLTTGNVTITASNSNIIAHTYLGNIVVNSSANLGNVGNVIITGGSNGQVLTTNGSGNLSWTTISTSSISNGNSNVNIPDANGNVNISAVGNANVLVVTGTGVNVAGTLNATGNANVGNIGTTGLIATGVSNLGAVGNVIITGGSNGQVLTTNGSGNLSWTTVAAGGGNSISNGTSNISIPTSSGNIIFGVGGTPNVMTVYATGIITGVGQGGNISNANVITANTFTGIFANGNSNVSIPAANGNVNISAGGTANLLIIANTGVNVPANITVGNLVGTVANGNSNIRIAVNANIALSAVGNSNVFVVTGTGANVFGTANVTGNLIAANLTVGTGSGGNLTGANVISANTFIGNLTGNTSNMFYYDDISSATDGIRGTFPLRYNQVSQTVSDPFYLDVSVNGLSQPTFIWNSDVLWQTFALGTFKGYTIISVGNITFTTPPLPNSDIAIKTSFGRASTVTKRAPFLPADIMLGT